MTDDDKQTAGASSPLAEKLDTPADDHAEHGSPSAAATQDTAATEPLVVAA